MAELALWPAQPRLQPFDCRLIGLQVIWPKGSVRKLSEICVE